MAEYSKHQQQIVRNYYNNQETISLQRLGELVTDLYLAEGKQAERLWKNVNATLGKLKVPATRVEHIEKKRDIQMLARLLEELLAKKAG
ncbi:MAG: hypothetical protein K1X74_13280 [Pirellulales bacterium]|nr:hypothetical protein [Pirellulales bacterium]